MRYQALTIILVLLSLPLVAGEWTQYYFRFEMVDKAPLIDLSSKISIDKISGNWVYAYANDAEWAQFQTLGFRTQTLPAPSSEFPAVMASSHTQLRDWNAYPTYDAYVAMMNSFASNYPNLCQIVNVGTTVNGRALLIAKISDNVSSEEPEPEVLLTSTIHGDETTGFMLMLRLIDTLLSQYGTDPRLTSIVNSTELWIGPNINPDGTYYGGNSTVASARRYNQNGIDLNRNYPNYNGSLNSGAIQPETQAMMDFANAHNFVFGACYHGGSEVVNYPWDYTYSLHPDDDWFILSSLVYASNVQADGPAGYFTTINSNGITNGAAWYVIAGGRQDWMNYNRNGREVTIECSLTKMPAASTMPNYWQYNYEAMISYLEESMYGIHGRVQDAWGNPLLATITVMGHDNTYSVIETDTTHGDFYRYLAPGAYNLLIETAGYPAQSIPITVLSNQSTPLIVTFGELPNQQQISLNEGWNLISLNVQAPSYLVEDIFADVDGLMQVKNTAQSYSPQMPDYLNTLYELCPSQAYWVNVSTSGTLTITGPEIDPVNHPISLDAGWNLIPYLPEAELAVHLALASISTNLLELRSMYSSVPVSVMYPGQGYWVNVSAPCTLIYP